MNDVDWKRIAGKGTCVPLPRTVTQISDQFTVIYITGPEFASLQRAVTYPITLDMMMGTLVVAIEGMAERCKRDEARQAYRRSLSELHLAWESYRRGDSQRGLLRTKRAQHLFREGALPRYRISEMNSAQAVLERILALDAGDSKNADARTPRASPEPP
jgi:hypothetical protein